MIRQMCPSHSRWLPQPFVDTMIFRKDACIQAQLHGSGVRSMINLQALAYSCGRFQPTLAACCSHFYNNLAQTKL
ncbi:hypothetical protein KY284_035939 [Solanum tuberosum]|nr:hypothetical protein KY284_035939 [Solanum tuberosum]